MLKAKNSLLSATFASLLAVTLTSVSLVLPAYEVSIVKNVAPIVLRGSEVCPVTIVEYSTDSAQNQNNHPAPTTAATTTQAFAQLKNGSSVAVELAEVIAIRGVKTVGINIVRHEYCCCSWNSNEYPQFAEHFCGQQGDNTTINDVLWRSDHIKLDPELPTVNSDCSPVHRWRAITAFSILGLLAGLASAAFHICKMTMKGSQKKLVPLIGPAFGGAGAIFLMISLILLGVLECGGKLQQATSGGGDETTSAGVTISLGPMFTLQCASLTCLLAALVAAVVGRRGGNPHIVKARRIAPPENFYCRLEHLGRIQPDALGYTPPTPGAWRGAGGRTSINATPTPQVSSSAGSLPPIGNIVFASSATTHNGNEFGVRPPRRPLTSSTPLEWAVIDHQGNDANEHHPQEATGGDERSAGFGDEDDDTAML